MKLSRPLFALILLALSQNQSESFGEPLKQTIKNNDIALQQPTKQHLPNPATIWPPNQEPNTTAHHSVNKKYDPAPLLIAAIVGTETPKPEPAQDEKKRNAEPDNEWTLAQTIAAVAVVVGFLQFVMLVLTWFIMRKTANQQLRAYIFPDNVMLGDGTMLSPPQHDRADWPGIVLSFKNSGKTPAYKVRSWAEMHVIMQTQESKLIIPDVKDKSPHPLGANGSSSKSFWFDRPLTPHEIADISKGSRAIYVQGRIEYIDAFKKERYTNFRLFYTGPFPPPPGTLFSFCDSGNEAN